MFRQVRKWPTRCKRILLRRDRSRALGSSHHIVGRSAIVQFIAHDFHTLFVRDVSIEVRGVFEAGNTVVVEQRLKATLASGRQYDNDYCFLFAVRDGRIAQVREYMDTQRGKQCLFGQGEEGTGLL